VALSRDAAASEFSRDFYCTYVIEAPRGMLVVARLNHVQLPMLGTSCRASVLRLYDGNGTRSASRQLIGAPAELTRCLHVTDTIRYDTRCYFNVRSKADICQLNLPHGTDN